MKDLEEVYDIDIVNNNTVLLYNIWKETRIILVAFQVLEDSNEPSHQHNV